MRPTVVVTASRVVMRVLVEPVEPANSVVAVKADSAVDARDSAVDVKAAFIRPRPEASLERVPAPLADSATAVSRGAFPHEVGRALAGEECEVVVVCTVAAAGGSHAMESYEDISESGTCRKGHSSL